MMTKRGTRDPLELLPLKPIELLVLTMLSAGDRHGYGIRQDIAAHTDGRIALEAGNLYRHIRALQADGLVDETEPRPVDGNEDERRIYYTLLPFRRGVLAADLARLIQPARPLRASRPRRRARAPARVDAHRRRTPHHRPGAGMTAADRLYRLLLRLYPRDFRDSYRSAMLGFHRDRVRAARTAGESLALLWLATIADALVSATGEWL